VYVCVCLYLCVCLCVRVHIITIYGPFSLIDYSGMRVITGSRKHIISIQEFVVKMFYPGTSMNVERGGGCGVYSSSTSRSSALTV